MPLLLVKKGRTAGLQVREGMQWNSGAGKAALKRVEQLGLFDKVNVELAAASDSDCGDREPGIALHFRLKESPRQSADVNTEWSFLCNDAGRPDLVHTVKINFLMN
jgi:outer membrane protein assembly factor BamA